MSFDLILKKLVLRVEGAVGSIFIDREGEEVAHYAALPDEEIKLMGAHYGILWSELEALVRRHLDTRLRETIFFHEKGIGLMRPLQKDYLVFLLLKPSGSVGQARRWLKSAVPELEKEI